MSDIINDETGWVAVRQKPKREPKTEIRQSGACTSIRSGVVNGGIQPVFSERKQKIMNAFENSDSISHEHETNASNSSSDLNKQIEKEQRVQRQLQQLQVEDENSDDFKIYLTAKYPVKIQIKAWGDSQSPLSEMIRLHNTVKRHWENPKFINVNFTNIIDYLAKNWRGDVLKYLRENNINFKDSKKYIQNGPSPFHKSSYPSSSLITKFNENPTMMISNFKNTFIELINYRFNIFAVNNKDTSVEDETFVRALFIRNSVIPEEAKEPIYKFYTEEWDNFDYMKDYFHWILNLLNSDTKITFACDKVLYFISRYPEKGIPTIINWILTLSINGKRNNIIDNFVNSLMRAPADEYDYYMYLQKFNLDDIRHTFINSVVTNYHNFIDMRLKKISGPSYTEDAPEFNKCYVRVMLLLGSFYSINFAKDQIIDCVVNFLSTENKYKIDASAVFLERSGINLTSLSSAEQTFVNALVPDNLKKIKATSRINLQESFEKVLGRSTTIDEIISFKK